MVHPDERVRYVSEILDDGGQAPVFQVKNNKKQIKN